MTKAFTRFRMPWRWSGRNRRFLQKPRLDDQGNSNPPARRSWLMRGQWTRSLRPAFRKSSL